MSRRSHAQRLALTVGLRLHDTDADSLKAARDACDHLSYEIAKLEAIEATEPRADVMHELLREGK